MNLFKELKSGSAGKIQIGQFLHTMSTALKDNTTLRFAVITGCLKIAKESIFTGTNNFVPDNITDSRFNEYFGFTQEEVDQIRCILSVGCHELYAGSAAKSGSSTGKLLEEYK